MISEVVPRGKEFLFFALFSIIGVSLPSASSHFCPGLEVAKRWTAGH